MVKIFKFREEDLTNLYKAYKIKNTPNIILNNFEVFVDVAIISNLIITRIK